MIRKINITVQANKQDNTATATEIFSNNTISAS
jgi:hypothetical protein